jgi:hypothetical protein
MIRYKYPFEYELIPETLEKGTDWLSLRLKNDGPEKLQNLDVMLHSRNSLHISFRDPSNYISVLNTGEERTLYFRVDANGTTDLYVSIKARKNGNYFYWDSPWIREEVIGEPAELESIFVSTPYGTIGKELEVDATIKGLKNSEGLTLEFWADTPSGKYEELAKIKTEKISRGEEASYSTKITPKEKGYYTVYANLYNNSHLIGRSSDIIWIEA